jgi:hypothetical protein
MCKSHMGRTPPASLGRQGGCQGFSPVAGGVLLGLPQALAQLLPQRESLAAPGPATPLCSKIMGSAAGVVDMVVRFVPSAKAGTATKVERCYTGAAAACGHTCFQLAAPACPCMLVPEQPGRACSWPGRRLVRPRPWAGSQRCGGPVLAKLDAEC